MTESRPLSMEEIEAGLARLERGDFAKPRKEYRHFRPLVEAAMTFEREAKDGHRIYLGIDELDVEMRGISAGHLAMIVGYSHSGKTLVALHALRHNRHKRIVMFIPDEPATLVLTKLACVQHGISARELERRVAANDGEAIDILRRTATEEFPNLAVFDKSMIPGDMERAYDEVCDVWGAPADLVVVDYLELLGAGETVQSKADWIKSFGMKHSVPLMVLHQTSRSAGAEGRAMTISSGSYGGEQHATYMIGVRRKKAAIQAEIRELEMKAERTGLSEPQEVRLVELRHDLAIHQYTLSVNLVKNKRPGGGLVEEVDFELFTDTGALIPLRQGEIPDQYYTHSSAYRPQTVEPVYEQQEF